MNSDESIKKTLLEYNIADYVNSCYSAITSSLGTTKIKINPQHELLPRKADKLVKLFDLDIPTRYPKIKT